MDDSAAFVRLLVRTSALTEQDVADLRDVFEFFRRASAHAGRGFVEASQAARALKKLGFYGVTLTPAGGVVVQDDSRPKLLVNEQEFLLIAARLTSLEAPGNVLDNKAKAIRLFRSLDTREQGEISTNDMRSGLSTLGYKWKDAGKTKAFMEKIMRYNKVLNLEDDDERSIDLSDFVQFLTKNSSQ